MADPNALYSAVAQSTAAFVAIVGGVMGGVVLNRAADRSSLQARTTDQLHRIRDVQEELLKRKHLRDQAYTGAALARNYRRLVVNDRLVPAEEAKQMLGIDDALENVFEEEWRALDEDVSAARSYVDEYLRYQSGSGLEASLDDWRKWDSIRKGGVPQRVHELANKIASEVVAIYDLQARAQRGMLASPSNPTRPAPSKSSESRWLDETIRELNRHCAAYDELQSRLLFEEREYRRLSDQLAAFRYPPHLRGGLASLAFCTVTGVILPLILMPQEAEDYCWRYKFAVLAGFLIGVAAVAAYVIFVLPRPLADPTSDEPGSFAAE